MERLSAPPIIRLVALPEMHILEGFPIRGAPVLVGEKVGDLTCFRRLSSRPQKLWMYVAVRHPGRRDLCS